MELSVRSRGGDVFVYESEGELGDIGRVTRAYCRAGNGRSTPVPFAGNIAELCETYPKTQTAEARLTVEGDEWVFVDATGNGRVERVEGRRSAEFHRPVETMGEAATAAGHEKGRSLYHLLGDSVEPAAIPTIPGSCGSQIKLIAESAQYKQYALLHAMLPGGQDPNEVHRYKIGGDIFFIFIRGQAVVNHTAGGLREFHSVAVSLENRSWHLVVLPPQEFYQVLNVGSAEVEYFMFFMEHNDAYARNAFESLPAAENIQRGWSFAYPKGEA
ncbi:hypothetical protein SBA4_5890019 [Candidatus Sulfopaludibacter sp. SbA4]|nr:hypothetical protein SBA4_5890019 [Candidatus Sulfopaludibacter sp. SbA4]